MTAPADISRRSFFTGLLKPREIAIAATGGLVWSQVISDAKADGIVLRPPGAVDEPDFLATCIRCGQCVEACPFDTLKLAELGDSHASGMPYFEPREVPCYMCGDVPCIKACPTDTLIKDTLIEESQMGLAVLLDHETCLAFLGMRCEACYRACPIQGDAITLEFEHNENSGRHAYFIPVVHSDKCTGCGKCENACVIEQPAIRVLPREIAQGEVGNHYRFNWDRNAATENSLRGAPDVPDLPNWEDNQDDVLNALEDLSAIEDE